MAHKFFLDKRPHNGLSYLDYKQKTIDYVENTNPETLEETEKTLYEYKN